MIYPAEDKQRDYAGGQTNQEAKDNHAPVSQAALDDHVDPVNRRWMVRVVVELRVRNDAGEVVDIEERAAALEPAVVIKLLGLEDFPIAPRFGHGEWPRPCEGEGANNQQQRLEQ